MICERARSGEIISFGRLPEMNCCWRKCCLASYGLGKISFPLNFSSCSNLLCVPFAFLLPRERQVVAEKCVQRLFMFLEADCQLHYGDIWINTVRKAAAKSRISFAFSLPSTTWNPRKTLEFFSFRGELKERQRFLKSKLKTRDNFYFVCFLFCLIWFWALRLIYWFIIFGCKVFWPWFLQSFSSFS